MPTGYTAELMEKGQDFREFALQCARAMGACIMQRDDPMNEPPKVQEPSDYSNKRLDEATTTLVRLKHMTNEQCIAYGDQQRAEETARYRGYIQKNHEQNLRIDGMVEQVMAWEPPSPEHVGLKDFMLQQLSISRNKDDYYVEHLGKLATKSPRDFYVAAVTQAERDIEYHTKGHAEEVRRTTARNDWIKGLYASLLPEPPAQLHGGRNGG